MKKYALLTLMLAGFAQAQFVENNAQPLNAVQSVAQVKELKDDARVTLEGHISGRTQQGDDEEYLFSDGKDSIVIEIDDELWQGQQVNAQTRLRIHGKLDRDFNSVEIKVKRFEILK